MSISTIKTAIQAMFAAALPSAQVIFANQNGVKPPYPFVTLYFTSLTPVGHDEFLTTDGNGDTGLVRHYDIVLNFQAFGPDSMQLAIDACNAIERAETRNTLIASGVYIVDRGQINDLTEFLETEVEERTSVDITFRAAITQTENTGFIEQVDVTEVYNDSDGSTAYSDNYVIGG